MCTKVDKSQKSHNAGVARGGFGNKEYCVPHRSTGPHPTFKEQTSVPTVGEPVIQKEELRVQSYWL